MHRRIAVAVKFRLGVNHRFRLLRAGGAVEVGQRLAINLAIEKREIRAHAFHRNVMPYPRQTLANTRQYLLPERLIVDRFRELGGKGVRIICCAACCVMPRDRR